MVTKHLRVNSWSRLTANKHWGRSSSNSIPEKTQNICLLGNFALLVSLSWKAAWTNKKLWQQESEFVAHTFLAHAWGKPISKVLEIPSLKLSPSNFILALKHARSMRNTSFGTGVLRTKRLTKCNSSPSYEIRSNCHGSRLERSDHHHLLLRFQAVVLSWTRGHNQICSKMEATSRKKHQNQPGIHQSEKCQAEQIKVMSHDFVSNKKDINFKISTTWGAAPITQELGASMDRGTTPAAASNNCAAPRVFCLPNRWIPCNTGHTLIVKVRLRHKICWKQDLSGFHHQNKKERTPECFLDTYENVTSELSVEGVFSSNQAACSLVAPRGGHGISLEGWWMTPFLMGDS